MDTAKRQPQDDMWDDMIYVSSGTQEIINEHLFELFEDEAPAPTDKKRTVKLKIDSQPERLKMNPVQDGDRLEDTGGVKTIDDVLYAFADYIRHHDRTGLGGVGIPQDQAKAQLESIMQDYAMKYGEKLIGTDTPSDARGKYPIEIEVENDLRAELRTTNRNLKGVL